MDPVKINPFPGIRPFLTTDSHFFFGREVQTDELHSKLLKNRFLAVIGSSGTGKSSLVRAGLIPILLKEGNWEVLTMRPGNDPISNLANAINTNKVFANADKEYTKVNLDYSSRGLVDTIKEAGIQAKILLVIDQFEELFRYNSSNRDQAVRFVNLVLSAANDDHFEMAVIITMRSEYLGDCTDFRGLPEKINNGQFLIPRLTRNQSKEAIIRPLEHGEPKTTMRPGLVSRIINDINIINDIPVDPDQLLIHDQLPILQHALMRTWEKTIARGSQEITIEDYEKIGGLTNALNVHADEIYDSYPNPVKDQVKEVFKMITKISGGLDRRNPIPAKLISKFIEVSIEQLGAILIKFRKSNVNFLMPPVPEKVDEETNIDISHESLMRNWKRLESWMREEDNDKAFLLKIVRSQEDYDSKNGNLLGGRALAVIKQWPKLKHQNFFKLWASQYISSIDQVLKYIEESKRTNYNNYLLKVIGIPAALIIIIVIAAALLILQGNVETAEAKAEKAEAEKNILFSKNYDNITRLRADSVAYQSKNDSLYRLSKKHEQTISILSQNSGTQIKLLLEESKKNTQTIIVIERDLKKAVDSLQFIKSEKRNLESEKLVLTDQNNKLQEESKVAAYQNGILQKELAEVKKILSTEKNQDFSLLSDQNQIRFIYFNKSDSITGHRILNQISKSRPELNSKLISREDEDQTLKISFGKLGKGIFGIGVDQKMFSNDLEILRNQLEKMGLPRLPIEYIPVSGIESDMGGLSIIAIVIN